jgi:hypothetical protein
VALYDAYLDAVYANVATAGLEPGRERLVQSLVSEAQRRQASNVFDCAAGTGFPALDLATGHGDDIEIHCTDGDRAMIGELARKASERGLAAEQLVPPGRDHQEKQPVDDRLVLAWGELDRVRQEYDYVLCRGNSLAYAGTWMGYLDVASTDRVDHYLRKMADRVRPGGYLHVDAPWDRAVADATYPCWGEVSEIREQISVEPDHRHWRLAFELHNGSRLVFHRFSSLLTIRDVEEALQRLGFEETQPRRLPGEREVFGVIIARKPD